VDWRLSLSNLWSRIRAQRDVLKYWLTGLSRYFHGWLPSSPFVISQRVESLSSEVDPGTSLGARRIAQ
jgi:hypothetical protein